MISHWAQLPPIKLLEKLWNASLELSLLLPLSLYSLFFFFFPSPPPLPITPTFPTLPLCRKGVLLWSLVISKIFCSTIKPQHLAHIFPQFTYSRAFEKTGGIPSASLPMKIIWKAGRGGCWDPLASVSYRNVHEYIKMFSHNACIFQREEASCRWKAAGPDTGLFQTLFPTRVLFAWTR